MDGFYPPSLKRFKVEPYNGKYDIIDTTTGVIVATERFQKDAFTLARIKNNRAK
jgi:hypothetical protein